MKRVFNQKGFAVVETLLILVIIGMAGGVGYYVWHAKQASTQMLTKTTQDVKPAPGADKYCYLANKDIGHITGHIFHGPYGKYSICIPDAWVLGVVDGATKNGSAVVSSYNDMFYNSGKPVVVHPVGGSDGGSTFAVFYNNNYISDPTTTPGTSKVGAVKAANVQGSEYVTAPAVDGLNGDSLGAGSKTYTIAFAKGKASIVVSYTKVPSDVLDHSAEVVAISQSLTFN